MPKHSSCEKNLPLTLRPTGLGSGIEVSDGGAPYERGRCSLRTKVRLPHSLFFDVERSP